MPRERRRRRRIPTPPPRQSSPDLNDDRDFDGPGFNRARHRWLPTLGVFVAFSLGLWIGGILSVADSASAVALLGGALGVGIGGARLLGNYLRQRRIQMLAEREEWDNAEEV